MGRRLNKLALLGATVALMALGQLGGAASAADDEGFTNLIFCRASAARVLTVEPTVANAKTYPCDKAHEQFAVLPVGTLAIVEGLGADTTWSFTRAADELSETLVAAAEARVASAFIFGPGLPAITVAGAFSSVTWSCTGGGDGFVQRETKGSKVAHIRIGAKDYDNVTTPRTISLGAVKVLLNQSPLPGFQRAVEVQLNGNPLVVLGEAAAGDAAGVCRQTPPK
jgi:hypothetical protein